MPTFDPPLPKGSLIYGDYYGPQNSRYVLSQPDGNIITGNVYKDATYNFGITATLEGHLTREELGGYNRGDINVCQIVNKLPDFVSGLYIRLSNNTTGVVPNEFEDPIKVGFLTQFTARCYAYRNFSDFVDVTGEATWWCSSNIDLTSATGVLGPINLTSIPGKNYNFNISVETTGTSTTPSIVVTLSTDGTPSPMVITISPFTTINDVYNSSKQYIIYFNYLCESVFKKLDK